MLQSSDEVYVVKVSGFFENHIMNYLVFGLDMGGVIWCLDWIWVGLSGVWTGYGWGYPVNQVTPLKAQWIQVEELVHKFQTHFICFISGGFQLVQPFWLRIVHYGDMSYLVLTEHRMILQRSFSGLLGL